VAPAQVGEAAETGIGESRWPPALALVAFIAVNVGLRPWLPHEGAVRLPWLVPAVEAVLLVALIVANPGNISKRGPWLRGVSSAWSCAAGLARDFIGRSRSTSPFHST
jgi:hypothetical protein